MATMVGPNPQACDSALDDTFGSTHGVAEAVEECNMANPKPADLTAKHMHGKQEEWTALVKRDKPLQLLDLPHDILQAVLREITHTNDLTALALTHSSLHELVIPHIYSRFDIVWPEVNTHVQSRIGVDALTYGLATLVMASDVFGEAPYQQDRRQSQASNVSRKVRRGNHFACYTKKFSLGNGPADWVQEYLITKEGGKMLGTLVALAVGRMRNLEAFIWDMPTGVLRDIWLALASLGNREDGQDCRLEKVWVRWHDNTDQGPLASPPPPGAAAQQHANIPSILAGSAQSLFQIPPYPRVEFPTFSILPPLKSLSVLDIDELPYAEEMSVLIERSLSVLRELRVGISHQAQFDEWTRPSEDRAMLPPPMMTNAPDTSRPGGVLGIIFGQFCEPLQFPPMADIATAHAEAALEKIDAQIEEAQAAIEGGVQDSAATVQAEHDQDSSEIPQLSRLLSESTLSDETSIEPTLLWVPKRGHKKPVSPNEVAKFNGYGQLPGSCKQSSRLQLDILEIERIHLSIHALSRAIDWSRLTQLTILGCRNHELLWKELRKKFAPASKVRTPLSTSRPISTSIGSMFSSSRSATPVASYVPAEEYPFKLRRLHTDCVSPALLGFIKDTLAPDTLEWLFLQENTTYKSSVAVDTLYKGIIRRHRGSLKKLLIDSEVRKGDGPIPGSWKRWICNRELLTAITSGKMQLRELSMSIDYKDWHFFLRRLPNAMKLRSLHITHISEHVHGTVDSREAALQVLDIVSLRPDMELCYLGVQQQCFEVLEYSASRRPASPQGDGASIIQAGEDSEDNEEIHEEQGQQYDSELEPDTDGGEQTEDEGQDVVAKPSFRLREILFYDDKVSIFKARHGRL